MRIYSLLFTDLVLFVCFLSLFISSFYFITVLNIFFQKIKVNVYCSSFCFFFKSSVFAVLINLSDLMLFSWSLFTCSLVCCFSVYYLYLLYFLIRYISYYSFIALWKIIIQPDSSLTYKTVKMACSER